MRPKFKIWDKEKKCWYKPVFKACEGDFHELLLTPSGELMCRTIGIVAHESTFPDRYEVVLCTGLKDKDSVEIYEGDIFKFKYIHKLYDFIEFVGTFYFHPDELRYEIHIKEKEGYTCLSYISNGQMYDFEAIGNTRENPELLEA